MKRSKIKFFVALLAMTSLCSSVTTVFAKENIETRDIIEPDVYAKTDTKYSNGSSLKLYATAYYYAASITRGSYSVTPTCVGTTYLGTTSSGWTTYGPNHIECSATGSFLPNNSGVSFSISTRVSFTR